jgi:hypothetical protein
MMRKYIEDNALKEYIEVSKKHMKQVSTLNSAIKFTDFILACSKM